MPGFSVFLALGCLKGQVISSLAPALLVFCILGAGPGAAAERLALVIGNGAYGSLGRLPNPVADARLIAGTLQRTGFDVTLLTEADEDAMKRAIVDFGRRLRAASSEAVGLFYYAGHGVQSRGRNFLLPVNVDIRDEADLDIEAVQADWVLRQMESASNAINIMVLDACRNNPFARSFRSVERGLARMSAPTGSFVAYATAPGDVAADGSGRNSPYSAALAEAMLTPGMPIEQVFKRVRVDVLSRTGGRQTPWESSSLTGNFYFKGRQNSQAVVAAARPESPVEQEPGVEQAPRVAVTTPEPPASFAAETVNLKISTDFRTSSFGSCVSSNLGNVRVPLGEGKPPVKAASGGEGSDFLVSARPESRGAVVSLQLLQNRGADPIEVELDSLAPGKQYVEYSNVRATGASSACGGIVIYVQVVE